MRKITVKLFIVYIVTVLTFISSILINVKQVYAINTPTIYTVELEPIDDTTNIINPINIKQNMENSVKANVCNIISNYSPKSSLSTEEIDLLARVIHAESGNQDEIGKRLVADVVLNRMLDQNKSLYDIVYATTQFATVPVLYLESNTPTEEEYKIAEEESINEYNSDVYYFRTLFYHSFGTPAFQHGDHFFSTK